MKRDYTVEHSDLRGLITNVQRFSIHDGPGIRTTVFFKGCPLRCFWCHNPETWRMQQEVQVFAERCIGCGACFEQCLQGAHLAQNGSREFRRELCQACGRCVETCYAESLVMAGKWWTVEALVEELLRDQPFYEQSQGGITLSGGEPLLQQAFSLAVLQRCKQEGLDTAIETAATCSWLDLEELLPWLDLVMMDIKVLDDEQHRAVTGASNRRILENARRLAGCDVPLLIRTPVIPTVNDSTAAIAAIAEFIRDFPNLVYYELMPFHRLAEGKYRSLGLCYEASDLEPPSKETMQTLADCARDKGIASVKVG
ncbi:MAG: glycyl-radical enzyme activating protein [Anaerolineae bacterium]|nr:glycyl-radical enzyme activating protein [Anaerolineae bacterium]